MDKQPIHLVIPPKPRLIIQRDVYSCGATSVEMALETIGQPREVEELKKLFNTNPTTGTTHEGMIDGFTALDIPFERSYKIKKPFDWLDKTLAGGYLFLVRTLTFGFKHWILCYGKKKDRYLIADPAGGYLELTKEELQKRWEPRDWDGFAIKIKAASEIEFHPIQNNLELMEAFIATFLGFQEYKMHMTLKSFIGIVMGGIRDDYSDSWIALHEGQAIGGYFIGHRQITDLYSTYREVAPYRGKKGVEGVAIGILPSYRGLGIGNILRGIPKTMDADYIWGQHLGCLNNLEDWVRYGRKHLFSCGTGHVTLMELKK